MLDKGMIFFFYVVATLIVEILNKNSLKHQGPSKFLAMNIILPKF